MFGKAGTAAVLEELQKLQEREEIEPQLASNPTSQESLGWAGTPDVSKKEKARTDKR